MHGSVKAHSKGRLLVFNCHEAWVYQLASLDYDLDIVVELPGRHTLDWDHHARPLPAGARLLTYGEALTSPLEYNCLICHNPSDLMDIKNRNEPRILVLHLPVEARLVEEHAKLTAQEATDLLHHYVKVTGTHVVGVSPMKGRSWGFSEDIIPFGIDPDEYLPHRGDLAAGLRISNFVSRRRQFLNWAFHEEAFDDLPVTLVGHNPDLNRVRPSQNWDHLKRLLQSHRFYIHTADPVLEDGYNMATIEAMAAGLPVLGNSHPSSIIEHGINGFVSEHPAELRDYALRLLQDPDLAIRLGQAAQQTIRQKFSLAAFKQAFERAIVTARNKLFSLKTPRPAIEEIPIKAQRRQSKQQEPQQP